MKFSQLTLFFFAFILSIQGLHAQNQWQVVLDRESGLSTPKTYLTYGNGEFRYAFEDGYYIRTATLQTKAPQNGQYLSGRFDYNFVMRSIPQSSTLEIQYKLSSGTYRAVYPYGGYVFIPYTSGHAMIAPPDGSYEVKILSATCHYNNGSGDSADVTATLQAKVDIDQESVYDDRFNLGGLDIDHQGYTVLWGSDGTSYSNPRFYQIDAPGTYNPYNRNDISTGYANTELSGLVYGNGVYVAAIQLFDYGTFYADDLQNPLPNNNNLIYNFDAISSSQIPESSSVNDLTFANNLFVAPGYMGDPNTRCIYTSSDGSNWNISLLPSRDEVSAVTYTGSEWFAGGENNILYRSTNGYSWEWVNTSGLSGTITELSSGNGYIVAGTEEGGIYASKDGILWGKRYQSEHAIQNIVADDSRFIASTGDKLLASTFSLPGYPEIVSSTGQQFILPEQSVLLEVEAIGDATLVYQWYEGETGDTSQPITGATSSSYQTPQLNQSSSYWVRVSNSLGSDDSYTTALIMQEKPVITEQPVSRTVDMGAFIYHEVKAQGANLSYQWYEGFNGDTSKPLANKTENRMYHSMNEPGTFYYWVRISNDADYTDSTTIQVTVNAIYPEITEEPQDLITYTGNSSSLELRATGPGLTYQWYEGNSGDTSKPRSGSYRFHYVDTSTAKTTTYWARISNAAGSVDSRTVTVEVIGQKPVFNTPPQGFTTRQGGSQTLTLDMKYSPSTTNYQWYKGESGDTSQLVQESISRSYNPPVNTAGTFHYWVQATNDYGSTASPTITIIIEPSSYTSWLAVENLPTDSTGDGDPVKSNSIDGIPNIFRYLMGIDSTEAVAGTAMFSTGSVEIDGSEQATIQIRLRNGVTGANISGEQSSDMVNWSSAVLMYTLDTGDGHTIYTYRTSGSGDSAFIRLKATGY